MDLVTWLNRIDDALGCVVHVGAGAGAILESYAALPTAQRPRKLVLIEGDPEAARSLERAAAPYASVQVLPTPVAAHSGPMVWNRFSLRTLNGPLDASALTSIYPRLRRTQTTTLHCEAFADVLTTLDLTSSESERLVNALVFDVPGQESLLLAAMPPALLRQFQALLLRGCRMPLPPNGHVAAAAQERLLQQHFAAAAQQEHEDTLWPEVLMRFDATGYELSHLRQQVARFEAALKESNRAAQELESVTQDEGGRRETRRRSASQERRAGRPHPSTRCAVGRRPCSPGVAAAGSLDGRRSACADEGSAVQGAFALSMPSETPGGAPKLTRGMSAAAAVAAPCVSDTLLDRCRALWDQGDWPALAAYGVAMIEAHPQRASLALMIAMAHQALAQDAQTRLFVTSGPSMGLRATTGRTRVACRRS